MLYATSCHYETRKPDTSTTFGITLCDPLNYRPVHPPLYQKLKIHCVTLSNMEWTVHLFQDRIQHKSASNDYLGFPQTAPAS